MKIGKSMTSKIMEHHVSKGIPLFIKAKQIIDQEKPHSFEEIVKTIDEFSIYVDEVKNIRQEIIEATYGELLSSLIEPVDELFESEYKQ
jgi:hypothetical protein